MKTIIGFPVTQQALKRTAVQLMAPSSSAEIENATDRNIHRTYSCSQERNTKRTKKVFRAEMQAPSRVTAWKHPHQLVHPRALDMIPTVNRSHGALLKLLPIKSSLVTCIRGVRSKKRLYWPTDWLPFTWDFPEKPIAIFSTGDPVQNIEDVVDKKVTYKLGYEFLKDRPDVPESVRFLFKLENSRRKEMTQFIDDERTARFKRNLLDKSSNEYKVAHFTSSIRQLQEHVKAVPNEVFAKILINHIRFQRDKRLGLLHKTDKNRYNILIQELDIKHEPGIPGVMSNPFKSRKGVLRQMTAEYCEKLRKEKLEAYHEQLKQQQPAFEKEKAETLKWIEEMKEKYDISEYDLDPEYRGRLLFNDPPKPRKRAV